MVEGNPNKLTREVLPPQKQQNGIGVMVVAATAMFFAVASSAFILKARMSTDHCHRGQTATEVDVAPVVVPRLAAPAQGCDQRTVIQTDHGTQLVEIELCPGADGLVIGDVDEDSSVVRGIEIRSVTLADDEDDD